MTTPTEQNFNSFKGITGIHTNTANVVRDYVNMIPLGDTVVTRHGFARDRQLNSSGVTEVVRLPSGKGTTFNEYKCLPDTWELVASEYYENDKTFYGLYYIPAPPTGNYYMFDSHALAFVVMSEDSSTRYTTFVELINDGLLQDGTDTGTKIAEGCMNAALRGSKFLRNTTVGTNSFQETYVIFAGLCFQVSKQGRVRILPNPYINDQVLESEPSFYSERAKEFTWMLTLCRDHTYAPVARKRSYFYAIMQRDYDIAWLDGRLLFLDRLNNRVSFSCQDPSQYFRYDESSATIDTDYDAGTDTWFNCEQGISRFFDGDFSNDQTSDTMKYIETVGEYAVVVCTHSSYIIYATHDADLPFNYVTGGYIPVGGVKPVVYGTAMYLVGRDTLGQPTLISVGADASKTVLTTSDVSRRIKNPVGLQLFVNHGLHHIIVVEEEEDLGPAYDQWRNIVNGYTYCVDNQLWWRFHTYNPWQDYSGESKYTLGGNECYLYFYGHHYGENGVLTAAGFAYGAPRTSTYGEGFRLPNSSEDDAVERTSSEWSGVCPTLTGVDTPSIVVFKEEPGTNYDPLYGCAFLDYNLVELNQTFSKRAILTKLSVRMDTGRTQVSKTTVLTRITDRVTAPASFTDRTITETASLRLSYNRGQSFNSTKTRNLATNESNRNDREITWCGLGSGNSLCAWINYDSAKPTQIYAIDYSLV